MKKVALVLLAGALVYGVYFLNMALPTGTGYASKYLCSQLYLADRPIDEVFERFVKPIHPLFYAITSEADLERNTVTSRALGLFKPVTSEYRRGLGCTVLVGARTEDLQAQVAGYDAVAGRAPDMEARWPLGESLPEAPALESDKAAALAKVLERWAAEPTETSQRNTHAIVVVHGGELVAEWYAPGMGPQTPLLGWSMTKTITAALVGVLVGRGALDVAAPAPVAQWQGQGDPRGAITLDQMLRMSSGIDFAEVYGPGTDATVMLYQSPSMADYAATFPLGSAPGAVWSYSSGTTNMLARIVRDAVGGDLQSVHSFSRQALLDPLGMQTAIIEPDASGSFVGSSYMFASARDWARFGMMMAQGGVWQGQQILPEGWVEYMTTPAPAAPKGEYGAQTWLNRGKGGERLFPSLPEELFYLGGFNGQIVAVFPSRDLVVVRLGVTVDNSFDREAFLADVLGALAL